MSQGYNIEQQVESIKNFFFHIFTKLCQEISLDFQWSKPKDLDASLAIILSGKLFDLKFLFTQDFLSTLVNLLTSSEMFFHSIHHKTQVTASLFRWKRMNRKQKMFALNSYVFTHISYSFREMHNAKK